MTHHGRVSNLLQCPFEIKWPGRMTACTLTIKLQHKGTPETLVSSFKTSNLSSQVQRSFNKATVICRTTSSADDGTLQETPALTFTQLIRHGGTSKCQPDNSPASPRHQMRDKDGDGQLCKFVDCLLWLHNSLSRIWFHSDIIRTLKMWSNRALNSCLFSLNPRHTTVYQWMRVARNASRVCVYCVCVCLYE